MIDPLNQPIATLLRPYAISKLNTKEVASYGKLLNRGKEFILKENFYNEINRATNFGNSKTLKV
jgi:hypothetical protein